MADSFIQVPPDSTGKQLDTRTAPDGNHREVVVIGDPTAADVVGADAANGLDVDVTRVQGTVAVSNAALTALAGAIAGTEVQVDIVSGGGSGTQYTEDAAAPADPVGTALAMVRDDVLSALTSTDGDIVAARGTDKGELYVKHVDAIPVTDNGGVLTVDGTVIVGSSALPTGAATSALQLPNSHDVTVDNAAGAGAVNIQDGGNSITVDGTVALSGAVDTELPAAAALADNTANPTVPAVGAFLMGYDGTNWDRLQTGAATGGALKTDGSAVTQPVSAASLPLPTGAATLAEQQTQSTDLDAIRVATEILDNAIAGSEMQVDVVAALPAGTNNIGDVDIASALPAGTNNIGDVDVLSVIPGTAATNLGKAIDSAPGATDTGVAALVVRDDALATLTPADGDYTVLRTDSTGALWTRSTSAAGGTSAVDEAAWVAGTSTGTPLMGARDDTSPDTLAEDTMGVIRATTNRALHVNLRDAAGAELSVGGGTQYDEDTASTAADKLNMAGVVRKDTAATLVDTDGDRTQLQVDATGRLHVNGSGVTQPVSAASLPLPTGASTLAEQQTQTTHLATIAGDTTAIETAIQIMDDWDESDRAKVNPIVGQAGVAAGAGAVGATVQRVTLASDDPGVAHLATIAGDTTDIEAAVELIDDTVATLGTTAYTEATTKGLIVGAVRRDADTTLVDTTNEVAPLQVDANGRLKVEAFSGETLPVSDAGGALTVDNAGTFAVQATIAAGATSIAKAEDVASADGDVGAMVLAIRDDTLNIRSGTEGDYEPLHTDANGALWTQDVNSAAEAASLSVIDDWDESDRAKVNPIAGQAGVQGNTGVVTALTQRVVLATDVGLPAGTANIGDVDVLTLPALVAGTANIGDVDVLTMPVTEVVGDVAADAAVPANPLAIGGRASTAVPTAVSADGDSVYNWLNRNGLQVVSAVPGLGLNADPYTLLSETAQYTTTQTSAVLVAGGASERIVITSIQIQVGGTTAGTLQVYFGTGAYSRGTDEAVFDGEFAPSATLKPGFFAAPPGGFRAGALGDDILVTTSAAINPLTITVWYYILGV